MKLTPPPHPLLGLLLLALTLSACQSPNPVANRKARVKGKAQPRREVPTRKKASSPVTEGFVAVKAGTFVMGSAADEESRYTNEQKHRVTLTRDFEIAKYEVTQAQFQALMGYNPSTFKDCAKCPVEKVNWHEALAYTNALSKKAKLSACYTCKGQKAEVECEAAEAFRGARVYDCPGYRLPTDAEWEYAYRAGTKTVYYNGDNPVDLRVECRKPDPVADAIGWYCQNSGKRTHPVGQKKPNAWGLYDMGGNVWEWCHDKYLAVLLRDAVNPWGIEDSRMRVVRGGAWKYYSRGMRAACRAWYKPHYSGDRHGFRVARTR